MSYLWLLAALLFSGELEPHVTGSLVACQPLTFTFAGPEAGESDNDPNPFLDLRLQVVLTSPSQQRYDVPGFFDGDGESAPQGNVWRVRFTPEEAGTWQYQAHFRGGPQVAIDLAADAGQPLPQFQARGSFEIAPRDPQAPGFLRWGRLEYAGGHYLKFREGPYWLRGGVDEPENLLAYAGFVRTPPKHRYADHVADWRPGDPDWGDGQGRGIIGALNYLAEKRVNSVYFLFMNIGGDGKDVWPWSGSPNPRGSQENDNLHFDTHKLRQWEIVFDHAQHREIMLHGVLNEAEAANKQELDNGELGPERKLYVRELVARFGHHPALQWNLCEEYNLNFDLGPERCRAFADYLRAVDPYDHPITVHSAGDPVEKLAFTFGDDRFSLTSVQLNQRPIHEVTEALRAATRKAGRPLPISLDEFTLDRGQKASHLPVDDAAGHRREKLWPTYFSGGQIEFILEDLLDTDSFKTPERAALWDAMAHARWFMEKLPFWEMEPADHLSKDATTLEIGIGKEGKTALRAQVFAKPGELYAVYFPIASSTGTLDLTQLAGTCSLGWFNPRSGEFVGQETQLAGGGPAILGPPPSDPDEDWVALIRRAAAISDSSTHFPQQHWETRPAAELGLDPQPLERFAELVGGDGCVVRDGYLVHQWGRIDGHKDWASAAKPVLSTLLLAAVQAGRLPSFDALVRDTPWPLLDKDAAMTYRQLANMTSGYSRGEAPGAAWAYNDVAIQLYARSLEKVFGQPLDAALHEQLAALSLEDGEFFGSRNGLGVSASPRDYARLGWLWLNGGRWNDRQVLRADLLHELLAGGVPADLPRSELLGEDYLQVGSYGGGTDQTENGPGIYGFNFWFNRPFAGRPQLWMSLPPDAFQANGLWSRQTVTVIPSLRMVVVARRTQTEKVADPFGAFDVLLGEVMKAAGYRPPAPTEPVSALETRGFGSSAHHWRKIRDENRVIQPEPEQAAYAADQVREIAANLLLFQRTNGGWPKDYDMRAVLTEGQREAVRATRDRNDTSFDNSNIHSQVDYLARAYDAGRDPAWREACLRGLDFILAAQYPSGGFPQRFPNALGYHAHITFNDGAMMGVLRVLRDAAEGKPHWSWLDPARRQQAQQAVERGIECVLKCQIVVDGKRTGWCQQHDRETFAPQSARTFELASICPQETTEIVRFLLDVRKPSAEIVAAVEAAVAWLREVQLAGVRVERVQADAVQFERHDTDFDKVVVQDASAPPLWARHYEIGTNRPIFAGRDAIQRYSLAEIERERRTGTAWYGNWPGDLLEREYPKWRAEHGTSSR
jgi:PelA/Pel-15E family pectate lyase